MRAKYYQHEKTAMLVDVGSPARLGPRSGDQGESYAAWTKELRKHLPKNNEKKNEVTACMRELT